MIYEEVKERILQLSKEELSLGDGVSEEGIAEAEKKLNIKFPKSFKSFLRDFGYGGIGYYEILGLGEKVPRHLDIVKTSLREWHECDPDYHMAPHLLPFCPLGTGDFFCFDTSEFTGDECPVIGWEHDKRYDYQRNTEKPIPLYETFAEWLDDTITDILNLKKNKMNTIS